MRSGADTDRSRSVDGVLKADMLWSVATEASTGRLHDLMTAVN